MTSLSNSARIMVLGGLTSSRALFHWITPWILIATFLVGPLTQIMLFVYLGRSAGVASDRYFVIGNALQYAAIPCLFAMGNTIGEREQTTLGITLSTPAPRIPLSLGRALPVILNGWIVALFALVDSFSCTGLGLVGGALALRVRETAVLANVTFGVLLIFCGVNVPLDTLPRWMAAVSPWLPMTHGIAAARQLADGASFSSVGGEVVREVGVGVAYIVLGMMMLSYFENESRRRATLEVF